MIRSLLTMLGITLLLGLAGCARSPEVLEDHARERLEQYAIWTEGKLEYDELLPDRPLIGLSFRDSPILDVGLRPLVHVKTLRQLDLSGCTRLNSWAMIYLKEQPNLKKLDVSGTHIRDEGLMTLSDIQSLEEINLSRCHEISDAGLGHLCKLRKLRTLDVTNANFISATGVWQFLQYAPTVDVKHWWVEQQRSRAK